MWVTTLQPNWATFSTRTFVQFCQRPECRTVRYRNKGTPVRYRIATVPDCYITGLRCWMPEYRCQLWSQVILSLMMLRSSPLSPLMSPTRGPPQAVAICSLAVAICSGRGFLCLAVAICSFWKKIFKKLILELILMFKKAFLPSST